MPEQREARKNDSARNAMEPDLAQLMSELPEKQRWRGSLLATLQEGTDAPAQTPQVVAQALALAAQSKAIQSLVFSEL